MLRINRIHWSEKMKTELTSEDLQIKYLLTKSVKNRTEKEHQILIKHFGGIRKYLLSMGEFKE